MSASKPTLGITMGDPAGVGPEIIIKALSDPNVHEFCKPLVVGDAGVINKASHIIGSDCNIHTVSSVGECVFKPGIINIFDLSNITEEQYEFGRISSHAGNAAFEAIRKAIYLAMEDSIDGTVTAPIHKESLNRAGHKFSGHTEIYAHYTKSEDVAMLLVEDVLKVVHVSTHVALREACDLVTKERILTVIYLVDKACKDLGIKKPRIGVAGLNPHASDGGLFGFEEEQEIIPAVKKASVEGVDVQGPIAPDTLYPKAKGGFFDAVVAMYHDQGHIPFKMEGFTWDKGSQLWNIIKGVNITLGLPIVRTSVDHGTAFDIAGTGTANHISLINAMEYAAQLAKRRIEKK